MATTNLALSQVDAESTTLFREWTRAINVIQEGVTNDFQKIDAFAGQVVKTAVITFDSSENLLTLTAKNINNEVLWVSSCTIKSNIILVNFDDPNYTEILTEYNAGKILAMLKTNSESLTQCFLASYYTTAQTTEYNGIYFYDIIKPKTVSNRQITISEGTNAWRLALGQEGYCLREDNTWLQVFNYTYTDYLDTDLDTILTHAKIPTSLAVKNYVDTHAGGIWGSIQGTLSNQTDLDTALNERQPILISGTNIKTINNQSIMGPGNITVAGSIDPCPTEYDGTYSLIAEVYDDTAHYIWQDDRDYLCFEALEDYSSIELGREGEFVWTGSYSLNKQTWMPYTAGVTGAIDNLNKGKKVWFRNGNFGQAPDASNHLHFIMSGSFNSSGNIMYLLSDNATITLPYDYCFYGLFADCRCLKTAPELPATTVTKYCYAYMFQDTGITTMPELPAPQLANHCYEYMFWKCSFLTKAEILPATLLYTYCYASMFNSCINLITAPTLPATIIATRAYQSMFFGCTALTKAPELPATTLSVYCYQNMFNGCTALTKIPKLNATNLVEKCYSEMFKGCTGIKVSETQSSESPHAYKIPYDNVGSATSTGWGTNMFLNTGGTFTGTPTINTTYYVNDLETSETYPFQYNITILTTDWNTSNECTKIVEWVNVNSILTLDCTDAKVAIAAQSLNSLTFKVDTIPASDITVKVIIFK